jgi:hypothetical protein
VTGRFGAGSERTSPFDYAQDEFRFGCASAPAPCPGPGPRSTVFNVLRIESDPGFFRFGRRREKRAQLLIEIAENLVVEEKGVVDLRQPFQDGGVCREFLPDFNERADDIEAHLDRSRTSNHIGRLQGAVFGENIRQIARITMFLGTGHNL